MRSPHGPWPVILCLTTVVLTMAAGSSLAATPNPEQRFREATALMRGGDIPGALRIYRELASAGDASVNLYWNWAQAAAARGQAGEAVWALLRGRDTGAADAAMEREIERLREALHLDAAELDPVPTARLGRLIRRWHLASVAMLLVLASLGFHTAARRSSLAWLKPAAWVMVVPGVGIALVGLAVTASRPTAVVTTRDARLLDAAAPGASVVATLREGEVVPVLDAAGEFLRIQDSSGARGWVRTTEAWRLDQVAPPDHR
ncbi:MAG TPA: SH3 domain-containing protein [Thermoanaerobaculaceae bacterium]|nr:SH3 domain-containing protein [Thermoanaerobaculaceae bacterium]HPS78023.1 SH3 domain-containing protein [Thermoanaerobaculaceae bacterium]